MVCERLVAKGEDGREAGAIPNTVEGADGSVERRRKKNVRQREKTNRLAACITRRTCREVSGKKCSERKKKENKYRRVQHACITRK